MRVQVEDLLLGTVVDLEGHDSSPSCTTSDFISPPTILQNMQSFSLTSSSQRFWLRSRLGYPPVLARRKPAPPPHPPPPPKKSPPAVPGATTSSRGGGPGSLCKSTLIPCASRAASAKGTTSATSGTRSCKDCRAAASATRRQRRVFPSPSESLTAPRSVVMGTMRITPSSVAFSTTRSM